MHQYKTIVQILLVLSILNPAFAAPIRRETTDGTSSSGVSPQNNPLPLEGSVPVQDSTTEASTSTHPLSATNGQVPAHDSITEASTSAHPLSATDGQVPAHDSITEASTSAHPLSATVGQVPAHDSITEASTSAHPMSAPDSQVPAHDSTAGSSAQPAMNPRPVPAEDPAVIAEGSTAEHWVPISHPPWYKKPAVKKAAIGVLSVAAVATWIAEYTGLGVWLHNKLKKD
jgi:hypothetical protein